MIAVCVMTYGDHDDVVRVRPHHRAYLHGLLQDKRAVSGGSLDPGDDGGLFLYRVESLADAEELARHDPYVVEGACTSWWVRQYRTHGTNPELLVVTD